MTAEELQNEIEAVVTGKSDVPKGFPMAMFNDPEIETAFKVRSDDVDFLFYMAKCLVHDREALSKLCPILGSCQDKWAGKECSDLPLLRIERQDVEEGVPSLVEK